MEKFEKTSLWQSSLAPQKKDDDEERARLREIYFDLRKRAGHLVSLVYKDLPGITVHDLTHLDSLWEIASLIAGDDYPLNPAEAFVLGGAFLLHDAGMCLAAYPNGIQEIKQTDQWKDLATSYLIENGIENPSPKQVSSPPSPILERIVFDVLRILHAKQAAKLPIIKWPATGKTEFEYLIQDSDTRSYYGPLIGKIAESHWWSLNELEPKLQTTINAGPGLPSGWTVDPMKISCLLRAADAAHIDHRRAPKFLKALTKPQGVSNLHWNFQGKLGKPSIQDDALVYSSGSEFNVEEAEAWWLCYETINMIDGQLRQIDVLLETLHKPRFIARRVRGAHLPSSLAKYIPTSSWKPVDTELKVTDVPSLVEMLGGAKLYGNDPTIPLRELIQNASDAIRARRLLEEKSKDFGKLKIRLRKEEDGVWLDFEDNGIGMAQRVLTGPLIDFGKSFWNGSVIRQEFPGLISKGMKSIGKFGIGFFSVFMLGEHVLVTTRRYDAAASETFSLDFSGGLKIRPILRKPSAKEALREAGTKVSVKLANDPYKKNGFLAEEDFRGKIKRKSLSAIVASTCPNLDINIEIQEKDQAEPCISHDDWIDLKGGEIFQRLVPYGRFNISKDSSLRIYAKNIRPLNDSQGTFYGKACIMTGWPRFLPWESFGVLTVGGLRAANLDHIGGILLGEAITVARDAAIPTVPFEILQSWASEQAKLISQSNLPVEGMLKCCAIVIQCGGNVSDLPIIRKQDTFMNSKEFQEDIKKMDEFVFFNGEEVEYDEDVDDAHPRDFKQYFEPYEDIFFISEYSPSIIRINNQNWPMDVLDWPSSLPKNFQDLIFGIIKEVWKEELYADSDERTVGEVEGEKIIREVTILRKG